MHQNLDRECTESSVRAWVDIFGFLSWKDMRIFIAMCMQQWFGIVRDRFVLVSGGGQSHDAADAPGCHWVIWLSFFDSIYSKGKTSRTGLGLGGAIHRSLLLLPPFWVSSSS